ncbi:MAG: outer membrane protein assembly factor BamA [Candidatus Cloacimonetes bacterium]|nr:outer membrane protein assembly factor BamA [Candidatus Cloacimonadota bacterium]
MKRILLIALLLAAIFAPAMAQEVITEIEVRGNQNIDRDLILSVVPFKLGDFLVPDQVGLTIKNLYQLGVFDDVALDAEERSHGIALIIRVTEFPVVADISIKGNRKLKDDKIEEITGLRVGSYWSPYFQAEIVRKVSEEYAGKGYHNAEIEFEVAEQPDLQVAVTLRVEEGEKIKLRQIRFHGNHQVSARKLRGRMKTKQASLLRSGKFEDEVFEQDLQAIIDYYNREGFVDARVISHDVQVLEGRNMQIDIYLEEGEQYRFGEVRVLGNARFTEEAITEFFRFKDDELFDMEKFNKQLYDVNSMYYEEGYIYARFDHVLEKRGDHIDILLTVEENTRARIHKIHFEGNRRTREKILRRQIIIHPGDYFRQSLVMKSQQNIYNLGFFEPDLYPDIQPINANGDVDLVIHVNDKTSGSANGGIGYNTQDSFVGQFSISQNNLFGSAMRAGLSWEFGGSTNNFEFDFNNPYFLDSNISSGFSVFHTKKEWDSYNYQVLSTGGSVRAGRSVHFLNYAKFILGYSYSAKKYEIQNSNDDASDYITELDGLKWQHNSSAYLTFSRDSRDNVFYPTAGSQFTIYQEIAGGILGGDFDYYKVIGEMRWFIKTFWKLVLRTKVRYSYVTAYGRSDLVPPEERFYLGGTGVEGVRGYPDHSIGPDDGGHRAVIMSSEYAFPIAGDQIIGLLFFDTGDSYDDLTEFNFWKMKKGAGLGLRVRSPFGLIGFDYAHNFDANQWEPHFQFGTTF